MTPWQDFFENIQKEIERIKENEGTDVLFFRGLKKNTYTLLPTLFREKQFQKKNSVLENHLYYDFLPNSAILHAQDLNSWEILYEMRHHGLPTRLLDWTESFSVALFFALNGRTSNPCIWILNPYVLNKKSINKEIILDVSDSFDYVDTYLAKKRKKQYNNPIAIFPIRRNNRVFSQKGVFTIHGFDIDPIEKICPDCVRKFEIPKDAVLGAKKFLEYANVNDFSLFPDLDGLCRYMKKKHSLKK
ncbi:FRG domain-containing protein [Methanoregula sp.]|jgi:hypothetical protein|uniref:FRG domain-containing protein n=1 Tax=Methanoregula sp. TaxID=2052170 RepID=UPI003C203E58